MTIAILIQVIILLLVCGMLIWCVQRIPGIPAPVLTAVEILVVLLFAIVILNQGGVLRI
jgi:hypothetical protein